MVAYLHSRGRAVDVVFSAEVHSTWPFFLLQTSTPPTLCSQGHGWPRCCTNSGLAPNCEIKVVAPPVSKKDASLFSPPTHDANPRNKNLSELAQELFLGAHPSPLLLLDLQLIRAESPANYSSIANPRAKSTS